MKDKKEIGVCASCERYNNEKHPTPCFWNRENIFVKWCADYKEGQ